VPIEKLNDSTTINGASPGVCETESVVTINDANAGVHEAENVCLDFSEKTRLIVFNLSVESCWECQKPINTANQMWLPVQKSSLSALPWDNLTALKTDVFAHHATSFITVTEPTAYMQTIPNPLHCSNDILLSWATSLFEGNLPKQAVQSPSWDYYNDSGWCPWAQRQLGVLAPNATVMKVEANSIVCFRKLSFPRVMTNRFPLDFTQDPWKNLKGGHYLNREKPVSVEVLHWFKQRLLPSDDWQPWPDIVATTEPYIIGVYGRADARRRVWDNVDAFLKELPQLTSTVLGGRKVDRISVFFFQA